jgi:hypothetical protein
VRHFVRSCDEERFEQAVHHDDRGKVGSNADALLAFLPASLQNATHGGIIDQRREIGRAVNGPHSLRQSETARSFSQWSSQDLVGVMPKSKHEIPGRVRATYEFIKANRERYSVQALCRVLEVAPSGYYDWLQQATSNRA